MYSYDKDLLKAAAFVIGFGFLFWFVIILLFMCFGPSEEQNIRNHAMQVIQEMDGCKVYRFYDGNYHYVTRCGEKVTTQKNWDEYCGKACTHHRTENITTEGNQ